MSRRRAPQPPRSGNPIDDALRRPDDLSWAHQVDGTVDAEPERIAWARPRRVRALRPGAVPERPVLRVHSLGEAQEAIAERATAYMADTNPRGVLLIRATAGAGKTHAAVALTAEMARLGRFGAFMTPRHDMVPELLAMVAATGGDPSRWYEWLPRQTDENGAKQATCRYPAVIGLMARRGLRPHDGCEHLRGCGWDYIDNGCVWHQQGAKVGPTSHDVVVLQHNHLVTGHTLDHAFSYVIGDESPIDAVLRAWRVPTEKIVPYRLTPATAFVAVLEVLADLARRDQTVSGPALMASLVGKIGSHQAVIAACEAQLAMGVTFKTTLENPEEASLLDYNHSPALAEILRREAAAHRDEVEYAERVSVGPIQAADPDDEVWRPTGRPRDTDVRRGLTMLCRESVSWRGQAVGSAKGYPQHMIWCDATGEQRFYEMLFQRPVEELRVDVAAHQRVFQVVDRANGVSALVDRTTGVLTGPGEDLVADVERIALDARARGRRVGVIGMMKLVDGGHFDRAASVDHATGATLRDHFVGQRGTNALRRIDTLIVAGLPQIPPQALHELAKCLILERDEDGRLSNRLRLAAFGPEGKLERVLVDRAYNLAADDGVERGIGVPDYEDPDLSALLWQKRDAELLQSIGRARGVMRADDQDPIEVWLLTNHPTDVLVDRLMTRAELYGAPPGVYSPERWPEIVQVAEEIADELGYVTVGDLWARLTARTPAGDRRIDRTTVKRYVELLGAHVEGWANVPPGEVVALRQRGRGRPPATVLVHRFSNQS